MDRRPIEDRAWFGNLRSNEARQYRFDFDRRDERGLAPVVREFNKTGLTVAQVIASNVAKRESGMLVKTFDVVMSDRSAVEISVKAGGVPFAAKTGVIGSDGRKSLKPYPMRAFADLRSAVTELADALRAAAEKRSRREKAAAKRAGKEAKTPKITTTARKRADAVKEEIERLRPVVDGMRDQLAAIDEERRRAEADGAAAQSELAAERKRNTELKATVRQLEERLAALGRR